MAKFKLSMPTRYIIIAVLLVVFLVAGHFITAGVLTRAQNQIVIQSGFFIIMAVSLNLVTGYLGQLPLGHAGFMAVGAYAATIFWRGGLISGQPSVIAGILIAGLVTAVFGVLIGVPALRLRGDYLAIITLGFGEIIRSVIINVPRLTGGVQGLSYLPRYATFLLVYSFVIITCACIHLLMKSKHGRAILSIRDNEIAAASCGVNVTYYKVMAFVVSAFFAGIAGALFAANFTILTPGSFDFMLSINILMMVVLGGMGSMIGSVISATILTSLPLFMQFLNEYRMIIFALMLIVVMIFKPTGLMGNYDFSLSRIIEKSVNWFRARKAGEKSGA